MNPPPDYDDDLLKRICEALGLDPARIGNIGIRLTQDGQQALVTVEMLVPTSVFGHVPEVAETIEH